MDVLPSSKIGPRLSIRLIIKVNAAIGSGFIYLPLRTVAAVINYILIENLTQMIKFKFING